MAVGKAGSTINIALTNSNSRSANTIWFQYSNETLIIFIINITISNVITTFFYILQKMHPYSKLPRY